MPAMAQQWIAYIVVAGAVGWLLRRWSRGRDRSACDRCGPATAAQRAERRGIRPSALRVLR